jgi:hypothetical protein
MAGRARAMICRLMSMQKEALTYLPTTTSATMALGQCAGIIDLGAMLPD